MPTQEDIGDSLEYHQRHQAAIAAYLQIPNPSAAIWNKMGIAYQMMYNVREATRCYNEALRMEPDNALVLNNLATVQDSQRKYGAAERLYRKALKIAPDAALILKNLGTNLMMQRKYERGAKAYQRAMQLKPEIFQERSGPTITNSAPAHDRGAINYFLARGCMRNGDNACAVQYLRRAINEGYTTVKKIRQDAEFAALLNDPGFQRMAAELQQPSKQR